MTDPMFDFLWRKRSAKQSKKKWRKTIFRNNVAIVLSNIDRLKNKDDLHLDDLRQFSVVPYPRVYMLKSDRLVEAVITLLTDLRKRGFSWESIFEKLFDETFRRLIPSESVPDGEQRHPEVPLSDSRSGQSSLCTKSAES